MLSMPRLLIPAVFALGCGTGIEPDQVGLAQEFTLAPGHWVRIQGEDSTVTFDQVAFDSRCPRTASCVWEGDAVVVLTLTHPARERASVELHTSGRFAQSAAYGDVQVALVTLAPEPREGGPIPQAEYRATLQVTR
jgi:hypothetical protein